MGAGAGAYDELAERFHLLTGAACSVLLILGGSRGHGLTVKTEAERASAHARLPALLRVAAQAASGAPSRASPGTEINGEVYRGVAEATLEAASASAVCIVILDGKEGDAFTILAPPALARLLPRILESLARQVERETPWGTPLN